MGVEVGAACVSDQVRYRQHRLADLVEWVLVLVRRALPSLRERIQLERAEVGVSMLRGRTGPRRLRCVPVRRGLACLQGKRDLGPSLETHDSLRRTGMRPRCLVFVSVSHHPSLSPWSAVLGLHPFVSVCVVRSGQLDVQRCIFNLHRRLFPIDVIRSKAQAF
jgi:hypothetical protein